MKQVQVSLAGLFGLFVPALLLAQPLIEVHKPWVREAPPTSRVLAGYMTILNTGDEPAVITGIVSPDFDRTELHRTRIEDGIATMVAVETIKVPPGGKALLEPGGLHLMLFDPKRVLRQNDIVRFELQYAGTARLAVEAQVTRDAGDSGEHPHHH
ncbi:MAG: copper chaperone PCu(A)C [Gammaproteobacteria bacterium]|nr:MAG: copper chaperone PCu(A)C [Gammaproteobacteria bacterium]